MSRTLPLVVLSDLHLGTFGCKARPLLAIPICSQVEQAYNAAGLNAMGVQTTSTISVDILREWLTSEAVIQVKYPDHHKRLVEDVLNFPALYK
jgi:hypothetical protein